MMGLAWAQIATAGLWIYEGFDTGVGSETNVAGAGLSGATSVGFAGAWDAVGNGNGTETAAFMPNGLSFSNLLGTPGSLKVSIDGSGTAAMNAYRQVTVGAGDRATVFGSLLFQTVSAQTAYVSVMGFESGASTNFVGDPITPHRLGDNDDPFRFNVGPDSWNSSALSSGVKVRRWDAAGSMAAIGGPNGITSGTTYLMVWKLTNAYTGGSRSVNQEGVVWVLSESQYTLGAGSLDEAFLDSNNTYKAMVTNGLAGGIVGGDYMNIAALAAGVTGANTTYYDEVRVGDTIADVTPVPEPASFALVLGALTLGLIGWRRRR